VINKILKVILILGEEKKKEKKKKKEKERGKGKEINKHSQQLFPLTNFHVLLFKEHHSALLCIV
jgi:hypothetical protein